MKKLLSVLLIAIFSLFTVSTTQAGQPAKQPAATQNAIEKAGLNGHFELWYVYNEKTGEYEIVCVWVEDDEDGK